MINHHESLTPRRTQSTGLFQRASDSPGVFSRRVFRGEGATENFTSHLKLAALTDIKVNLPRNPKELHTKKEQKRVQEGPSVLLLPRELGSGGGLVISGWINSALML